MTTCPKCSYERKSTDTHVLAGLCPRCGIAYTKWKDNSQSTQPPPTFTSTPIIPLGQRLKDLIFYIPENLEPFSLYWRAVVLALFFVWGCSFVWGGISWSSIGGSFLHNIILPFHEFGHVLFSPFGRFMTILGGSLFQVLMPLGILLVFTLKHRDNFAASIMLWWSGQSFIDVSPYIADAPYRAIPLIAGLGEEAHDWGNLLTMTNTINNAWFYAKISFGIGTVLMILSTAWGGYLLYLYYKQLNK